MLEKKNPPPVEHPVTELVYGVDLVEWQLRVAQGEKLPLSQEDVLDNRLGHAIEVRLCAEDPRQNYLPQTGKVLRWRVPAGEGVRVDTYLEDGKAISPYYDSMQAKIIAWGEDRETARARLLKALDGTVLLGVASNRDYLRAILATEAFSSGDFSTAFVGKYFPQEKIAAAVPTAQQVLLAAVALYLDDARRLADEHGLAAEMIGWHSSHDSPADFKLKWQQREYDLEVSSHDGRVFRTLLDGAVVQLEVVASAAGEFRYVIDGVQGTARHARDQDALWLDAAGAIECYVDRTYAPAQVAAAGSDGRIVAHSDGKIVAVHVKPGDVVEKGQTLVVLEAMKMEFQLAAATAGTVESVSVEPGLQVKGRQLLVQLKLGG
ncbi:MAG: biotin/lipoyl-containing protein [Nevskiales bacterium]